MTDRGLSPQGEAEVEMYMTTLARNEDDAINAPDVESIVAALVRSEEERTSGDCRRMQGARCYAVCPRPGARPVCRAGDEGKGFGGPAGAAHRGGTGVLDVHGESVDVRRALRPEERELAAAVTALVEELGPSQAAAWMADTVEVITGTYVKPTGEAMAQAAGVAVRRLG